MTDTGADDESEHTDRPWDGDVNDAVRAEWKADTTPFDRVTTVLDTTTEPQYAREIAERAAVSEPTARKHLSALADVGRAETVSVEQGTQYKRSRQTLATQRIAAIHREHTKQELIDAIGDLREQIQALQDEYDVTDPDDLAYELAEGADDWSDVDRWRSLAENLEVAKAALALFDFDPDRGGRSPVTAEDGASETTAKTQRRGSLARSGSSEAA